MKYAQYAQSRTACKSLIVSQVVVAPKPGSGGCRTRYIVRNHRSPWNPRNGRGRETRKLRGAGSDALPVPKEMRDWSLEGSVLGCASSTAPRLLVRIKGYWVSVFAGRAFGPSMAESPAFALSPLPSTTQSTCLIRAASAPTARPIPAPRRMR